MDPEVNEFILEYGQDIFVTLDKKGEEDVPIMEYQFLKQINEKRGKHRKVRKIDTNQNTEEETEEKYIFKTCICNELLFIFADTCEKCGYIFEENIKFPEDNRMISTEKFKTGKYNPLTYYRERLNVYSGDTPRLPIFQLKLVLIEIFKYFGRNSNFEMKNFTREILYKATNMAFNNERLKNFRFFKERWLDIKKFLAEHSSIFKIKDGDEYLKFLQENKMNYTCKESLILLVKDLETEESIQKLKSFYVNSSSRPNRDLFTAILLYGINPGLYLIYQSVFKIPNSDYGYNNNLEKINFLLKEGIERGNFNYKVYYERALQFNRNKKKFKIQVDLLKDESLLTYFCFPEIVTRNVKNVVIKRKDFIF